MTFRPRLERNAARPRIARRCSLGYEGAVELTSVFRCRSPFNYGVKKSEASIGFVFGGLENVNCRKKKFLVYIYENKRVDPKTCEMILTHNKTNNVVCLHRIETVTPIFRIRCYNAKQVVYRARSFTVYNTTEKKKRKCSKRGDPSEKKF